MSVFYRLVKNANKKSSGYGKWYARAVHTGVVTTDELADIMQENCTVKRSDILAVISELVTTMQKELLASKRVVIDRLGSFKIGLSGNGSETVKDYSVGTHVKGFHVLFMPETRKDTNGSRSKAMLRGARAMELPKNAVMPEEDAKSESGGTVQP